jgi:hypothetical protein
VYAITDKFTLKSTNFCAGKIFGTNVFLVPHHTSVADKPDESFWSPFWALPFP